MKTNTHGMHPKNMLPNTAYLATHYQAMLAVGNTLITNLFANETDTFPRGSFLALQVCACGVCECVRVSACACTYVSMLLCFPLNLFSFISSCVYG